MTPTRNNPPLKLEPGAQPVPGYCLVQRLGGGGFGEVWKAQGPGGFLLALKFVKLTEPAGPVERRALEIIKQIQHPHLLTTFGSWEVPGFLVIAMELARGTLWDRFREAVKQGLEGVPPDELLEYFREAAKAIDYLNEPRPELGGLAVQHRDIKPQNILLIGNGVKVGDFGLARVMEHTVTGHSGSLTVAYAAPEFFRGQVAGQSDQYSLAVTYCHMRGGRLPYAGNPVEIIGQQLAQRPDLTMVPEGERPVLARALALVPHERWPSCRAFVEQLLAARSAAATAPGRRAQTVAPAPGQRAQTVAPGPQRAHVATAAPDGRPTGPAGAAPSARRDEFASLPLGDRLTQPLRAETSKAPPVASAPPPLPPVDAPRRWQTPDRTNRRKGRIWAAIMGVLALAALVWGGLEVMRRAEPDAPSERPTHAGGSGKHTPNQTRKRSPVMEAAVSPKGEAGFATINEALENLKPGGTLRIHPGTYKENLTLTQPVKILAVGPSGKVIIESMDGPCIRVRADAGLLLQGLTLRGKGGPALAVSQGKPEFEGCDLTSDGEAAVTVWGAKAEPVFRKCTIHGSQGAGFLFHSGATGVLEGCEIFENAGPGIEIRQEANPTFRQCMLRDGKGPGVVVVQNGRGIFEDCTIAGNSGDGIVVRQRSEPTLRRCHFRQAKAHALVFADKGQGLAEDCDISGSLLAGVLIDSQAGPTLRGCTIADGSDRGVLVSQEGAGRLEGCTISANALAGVEIQTGGKTQFAACKLQNGKNVGLLCNQRGEGKLENCSITGNLQAGVMIQDAADPTLVKCKVTEGKSFGVIVKTSGKGTFDDCDIAANQLGGVGIGTLGNPTFRSCRLYDCRQAGLLVKSSGRGVLEDCSIHDNAFAGVEIREQGNPTLRRCEIYEGKTSGVYVHGAGKGTLTGCDIHDNRGQGVQINHQGAPVFRDCKIHDGKANGIYIAGQSKGTFFNCDIHGHPYACVVVKEESDPLFTGCKFHDAKQGGVFITAKGKGRFQDCDVYENTFAGIEVRDASEPVIRKCRLYKGMQSGVFFNHGGKGLVDDCTIYENGLHGVAISQDSDPLVRKCELRNHKGCGVLAYDKGKSTIEDCDIKNNTLTGVEIRAGASPTIKGCRINGNQWGIWVHDKGDGSVDDSDLTGNTKGAKLVANDSTLAGNNNQEMAPEFRPNELLEAYQSDSRKTLTDLEGKTIVLKVQGKWEVEDLEKLIVRGNLILYFFKTANRDLAKSKPGEVIKLIFPLNNSGDKRRFFSKVKDKASRLKKGDAVDWTLRGRLSTFELREMKFLLLKDAVLE
jgi:F-box protein 11